MRSNLTILEQNTLAGFEHEETQSLYLRGAQRDELKAFNMAYSWEKFLIGLRPIVVIAANQSGVDPHAIAPPEQIATEVMGFIRERHFRRYFPDN